MLLSLVAMGDATSIPEVGALADRLAHDPAERRPRGRVVADRGQRRPGRAVAGYRAPMVVAPGRVALVAPRLLALADAFGDQRIAVTPPAVALCRRLLTDGVGSPLYNPHLPERELDRRAEGRRGGQSPRPRAPSVRKG